MVLLVVDIGNTNIVVGFFHRGDLVQTARWQSDVQRMPDEYAALLDWALRRQGFGLDQVSGLAIASVVPPLTAVFEEVARRYGGVEPLVVTSEVDAGLPLRVDHPREVGADRIANAVGVRRRYGTPAIVVDLGTATTLDIVSADGAYLGGAIAPGVRTALEGLWQRTFRLPRIDLRLPSSPIGRNTVHAIQVGTIMGHAALVDGLVERVARELEGVPHVVATGGFAPLVAPASTAIQVVDVDLTLHGIRFIYERARASHGGERA